MRSRERERGEGNWPKVLSGLMARPAPFRYENHVAPLNLDKPRHTLLLLFLMQEWDSGIWACRFYTKKLFLASTILSSVITDLVVSHDWRCMLFM